MLYVKHGNMVVKPSSRALISQQYLQLVTTKVRNLEYGFGNMIENIQGETTQNNNYFFVEPCISVVSWPLRFFRGVALHIPMLWMGFVGVHFGNMETEKRETK